MPGMEILRTIALDIGCGDDKLSGSFGIDVRKTNAVNIIADARFLPFRDKSVDYVFSSHLIEHFSHRKINGVIEEWWRVLVIGGTIEIRCPDLRLRSLLFFFNPNWQNVRKIYGNQDYEGNYHKCGLSYGLLKRLLEGCGARKVKRVIKGYRGIPFLPDCLHVRAIK